MNFKLLDYYVGSVEDINEENSQGIIDMYTDAWFAYGHHKTVEYLTRHGVIVFQYLFAYEGQYELFWLWCTYKIIYLPESDLLPETYKNESDTEKSIY